MLKWDPRRYVLTSPFTHYECGSDVVLSMMINKCVSPSRHSHATVFLSETFVTTSTVIQTTAVAICSRDAAVIETLVSVNGGDTYGRERSIYSLKMFPTR